MVTLICARSTVAQCTAQPEKFVCGNHRDQKLTTVVVPLMDTAKFETRDRYYDFLYIFAKTLEFLTQNKAKNANFSEKIVKNRRKL
jgi:hypothetical protein